MTAIAVLADADEVARAAAARVLASVREGPRDRPFRLGLSGGRTPLQSYRGLAAESAAREAALELFFADERDAPPTEPESNYWLVRKLLVEPLGIPPERVHRMRADAPDLERAALDYEPLLAVPLDLLILGVGEDGHTASLFPGTPLVRERRRRVAAVFDSPKPPPRRLTLTARAIAEAAKVLVLATGEAKAAAVARALEGDTTAEEVPARLLRGREWVLDRAAARLLSGAAISGRRAP